MTSDNADTRATAYAFGELSPEQSAAFERELADSSQLQTEVAAIREAIAALESEFESQSTGVGDTQRRQIERAISQRDASSVVTPPPVFTAADQNDERSSRRMMVFAVLACSVLVVCGLAYPYLRGPRANRMTQNPAIRSTEAQQVNELVESFNKLIADTRYEEAEAVAQQVKQIRPDDPIATTMMQASEIGRRLVEQGRGEVDLAREQASLGAPSEPVSAAVDIAGGEEMDELSMAMEQESVINIYSARAAYPALGDPSEADMGFGDDAPTPAQELKPQATVVGPEDALAMNINAPGDRTAQAQTPTRRPRRGRQAPSAEMMGMGGMDMGETMEMEEMMDMDGAMGGMGMGGGGAGGGGAAGGGFGLRPEPFVAGGRKGMDRAGERDMEDEMGMMMMMGMADPAGDRFEPIEDNPFVAVDQSPLSTFSIDVDTASYAKVRSLLNQNALPRPDAVRIEELLNYFDYDYPPPRDEHPFAASMDVASCPWNPQHRLARVGIKGKVIESDRPSSSLVFLLDVSGSMDEPNKLPLVIDGMKMLTDQLTENDKVAIVVYAGAAGLVLDATRGDKKQQIVAALDRLKAGGSTNGGQGIQLAYEIARDNFIVGGTNRVILCSDGDFNVGVTGTDQLVAIAKENAKSDIFLSVLGFGTGNHNDAMMEQISNQGNGNYAFIDSKSEARKVLVEELGGTLITIAKDVKIQIEFNPKEVASYRLIGYENRVLAAEDFNDDKKDAGEIGAGHTVTALYEIVPANTDGAEAEGVDVPAVDELRYQQPSRLREQADSGELLILKLRYKQPEEDTSTLIEFPVSDSGQRFLQTDRDFKFAAAVAAFGMLLRNSPYSGNVDFAQVLEIARQGAAGDDFGYRNEFVSLVGKAKQLRGE